MVSFTVWCLIDVDETLPIVMRDSREHTLLQYRSFRSNALMWSTYWRPSKQVHPNNTYLVSFSS